MDFFQGTQERVETARVNEPSEFEPLKFYCISFKESNPIEKVAKEVIAFYKRFFLGCQCFWFRILDI